MEFHFSPYEIAEMAVNVEEEGAKFYTSLSNSAESEKLKKIFSVLAEAELMHQNKFREIADANRKEDDTEYSIDISMLMQRHIDELKELAFKFKSRSQTVEDALDVAVNTEKTAINIYSEMHKSFIAKFHNVLLTIIDEEKEHLDILEKVKSEV